MSSRFRELERFSPRPTEVAQREESLLLSLGQHAIFDAMVNPHHGMTERTTGEPERNVNLDAAALHVRAYDGALHLVPLALVGDMRRAVVILRRNGLSGDGGEVDGESGLCLGGGSVDGRVHVYYSDRFFINVN